VARRIAVELTLDVQRYIDNAVKAAMATKGVDEELKSLDRETGVVSAKMDELAVASAVAGKEVGNVGDKSNKATRELALLDRQIEATRRRVERLGIEFAATGDKVAGTKFNQQRSLLNDLERLRSTMKGLENDGQPLADVLAGIGAAAVKTGGTAAGALPSGVIAAPGAGATTPAVIGGVVAGLLPSLIPIGAMVSGLVVGTVGTGGIVGGVLAASHDPRVKAGFQSFVSDISDEFLSSGGTFVDPILRSLDILKADLKDLHLADTFALAAPDLEIIAKGLGDLVKNVMPGLNALLARSGPFAAVAAKGFADMGTALSELLDNVSVSRGSLEGLDVSFKVLNDLVKFLGLNLKGASMAFDLANRALGDFFTGLDHVSAMFDYNIPLVHRAAKSFQDLTGQTDATKQATLDVTSATGGAIRTFDPYIDSLNEAAHKAKALADATNEVVQAEEDMISMHLDLAGANIAVAQGFADLDEKLQRGKGNWDLNTQAGRDNQDLIRSMIQTLDQQRQAAIKNSDGSVAAINAINAKYDEQLVKLEHIAGAAGASTALLKGMEGDYHINVIVTLTERNQLNKAKAIDLALANLGFAEGGTTPANEIFKVGENGPEYLFSSQQQFVANQKMMSQQWSGGGAGGGGAIVVQSQITLLDPMTGQKTRAILISESTSRGVPSSTAGAAYP
jgi:hypothetical protein